MKREDLEYKKHIKPVFFAPLAENLIDSVSGNQGEITGSMNTFDATKGLYFNGNSGLKWSFSQLAFDPTDITIDKSVTLLLDYNRDARKGHDWMFVLGTDTNKQMFGFVYDYNSQSIDFGIKDVQKPQWTSCEHRTSFTELNTQYNNCGFTFDCVTKTGSRIINGQIVDTWSCGTFPTLTSSMYLYIGQSSYSGDKMNGYLKNVRFYLDYFDEKMII